MGDLDRQIATATDEVLATVLRRTKGIVIALSMADLADMRIADSGSDRVLDRNFDRTQSARNTLAKIEAEIARRASINTASPPSGGASTALSIEAGQCGKVDHL